MMKVTAINTVHVIISTNKLLLEEEFWVFSFQQDLCIAQMKFLITEVTV